MNRSTSPCCKEKESINFYKEKKKALATGSANHLHAPTSGGKKNDQSLKG